MGANDGTYKITANFILQLAKYFFLNFNAP